MEDKGLSCIYCGSENILLMHKETKFYAKNDEGKWIETNYPDETSPEDYNEEVLICEDCREHFTESEFEKERESSNAQK